LDELTGATVRTLDACLVWQAMYFYTCDFGFVETVNSKTGHIADFLTKIP
jgi:hypothetical protein